MTKNLDLPEGNWSRKEDNFRRLKSKFRETFYLQCDEFHNFQQYFGRTVENWRGKIPKEILLRVVDHESFQRGHLGS